MLTNELKGKSKNLHMHVLWNHIFAAASCLASYTVLELSLQKWLKQPSSDCSLGPSMEVA